VIFGRQFTTGKSVVEEPSPARNIFLFQLLSLRPKLEAKRYA
jgi:hypothetical protein